MEEKVLWITGDANPDISRLEDAIEEGWSVKSCTPQSASSGQSYARYGGLLVVLEKSKLDIL